MPASVPARHLLQYFVDRTKPFAVFEEMLKGGTLRLLCLRGRDGIGKTLLVSKMMQHCNEKGAANAAYIQWRPGRSYNYLDVLREIRDQIGSDGLFDLFNDKVNFFTSPEYKLKIEVEGSAISNVRVLENGDVQNSNVTVHVGHTIEIKDLHLILDRSDAEAARIPFQLTEAFKPCLKAAAARKPVVVIFDDLDKADASTVDWVWREFIPWARDNIVDKLYVVVAVANEGFTVETSFFDCSTIASLPPFGPKEVSEYLERRGVPISDSLVNMIMATTHGEPLHVGEMADAFISYEREREASSHA